MKYIDIKDIKEELQDIMRKYLFQENNSRNIEKLKQDIINYKTDEIKPYYVKKQKLPRKLKKKYKKDGKIALEIGLKKGVPIISIDGVIKV